MFSESNKVYFLIAAIIATIAAIGMMKSPGSPGSTKLPLSRISSEQLKEDQPVVIASPFEIVATTRSLYVGQIRPQGTHVSDFLNHLVYLDGSLCGEKHLRLPVVGEMGAVTYVDVRQAGNSENVVDSYNRTLVFLQPTCQ